MAEIKFTKENFEQEVVKSDKPVLIDFWASWCGPCKMFAPVVAQIAEEYDGKVKVGKVNVDDEPELAAAFNVASIPTVVIVKDGKIADVAVGFRTKDDIIEMLEA